MADGQRIVVGFDGSSLSHLAMGYIARRASLEDVVTIVYACGEERPYGRNRESGADFPEHRRARGRAILETAISPTGPPMRAIHHLELRDESPVDAIVGAAEDHDADYIVLGAAGVGSLERGLGSVATGVLERVDRPVLVVPRSQREESKTAAA